jgi:manganese-dependent inorganic pyrophosphatase
MKGRNKMENKVLIFGHKNPDTDSICSSIVNEALNKKNGCEAKAVRLGAINKETQYVLDYLNIDAPELIEKVEEGQELILVDHNEFNQSVEGIEKAKILSVVDHHKIGNFETSEPLYYIAKPYGCTSTILFEEFKQLGYSIDKKEAVLMASAIISDTLLLKSPTTTEHDKKALEELAKIAEIDINQYGLEMLKAGTDLDDLSSEELINLDAKDLNKNGVKYVIAQINTVSIEDVLKREEELKAVINKTIEEKGLNLFVFAITDILNSNSEIIALGEKAGVIKVAFGKELENDKVFLEGVVSRKKQLLPNIDKNI